MQHIAEFFKLHSSPHWTFVFLWPSVLTLSTCNIIIRLQLQKLPTSKFSFALTHEVPASWSWSSYTMWSGIFLPRALRKEAVIDENIMIGLILKADLDISDHKSIHGPVHLIYFCCSVFTSWCDSSC